jgi:large subunit ribosomal protein L13
MYRRHSGFPGGLKEMRAREMQARHPERLVEAAVRGMLGKSRMGRKQLKKLKVYRGAAHPHDAQKPRALAPIRRTAGPRTTEAN